MLGFLGNIEEITLGNTDFRRVVYTGQHVQLVVMSLLSKEEIGTEVHEVTDQFIRVEQGEGKAIMNGEEKPIKNGSVIIIPAGTEHNIINISETESLKLYTLYSPPHHRDGTVHKTKEDAEADTEDHL